MKLASSRGRKITQVSIESSDVLVACDFGGNILRLSGVSDCEWIKGEAPSKVVNTRASLFGFWFVLKNC